MRWVALTFLLSACTAGQDGDFQSKVVDWVELECLGWCRLSEADGEGLSAGRVQDRSFGRSGD